LGTQVGAGIGEFSATGDAGPLVQAAGNVVGVVQRRDEMAANRAFMLRRDAGRATATQQRQLDAWSIKSFGVPYQQADASMKAAVQEAVAGGPQAGEHIGDYLSPSRVGGAFAFGPGAMPPGVGAPGSPEAGPPSPSGSRAPPGMEEHWGPQQNAEWIRLDKIRTATIDNFEWRNANRGAVEPARQALAREYQSIRPGLRPKKPKLRIRGPEGEWTSAVPGVNPLQNGGAMIVGVDGGFEQYVAPTKRSEAPDVIPVTLSTGESFNVTPSSIQFVRTKDGSLVSIEADQNGKPVTKVITKGADESKRREAVRTRVAEVRNDLTVNDDKRPSGNDIAREMLLRENDVRRELSRKLVADADVLIANAEFENKPDDEAADAWLEGMIEIYGNELRAWPEEVKKLAEKVGAALADAHRRGF